LPTNVQNFAPYIKVKPFLMLMGTQDERNYTKASAQHLYDLIESKEKDLVFFDSGHMLPSGWKDYAMKWMEKYLQ